MLEISPPGLTGRGLETGSRRTYTGTTLEMADTAKGSLRGTAPVDPYQVLPAVVLQLAYDDLDIQEGTMAPLQFYQLTFEVTDDAERARIRTARLKPCERDTLAMVELRRALRTKAQA
ncbi:MAG: hypothetical protein ACHQ7N_14925 [Candidatus Methylomirabilales bacterium]